MEVKYLPNEDPRPEVKKYRLLRDLVRDWSATLGYPISPSESEAPERVVAIPMHSVSPEDCIVCMEKRRDTLILPCKHLNLCGTCAEEFENCPVCEVEIADRVKAYMGW